MRKLALLVTMLMVVLMVAAAPAMAQDAKAARQAQKAAKAEAKAAKAPQEGDKKATPETGGTLVDASVLGLGAGALLVGSGLVVRRIVR